MVIVTKMVNKSHSYGCYLIFPGPQGTQKQVTLKEEGVGPSGSPDWSPERARGCPKVTQPLCTGVDMSPHTHLGPRSGVLSSACGGDLQIETSSPWQPRALLAWDTSWGLGWSQALTPGGAPSCCGGAQHPWPPREGGGPAIPPSCGCNWFSSLSLPPSLSAHFSSLFLSLSHPPVHPFPPPPCGSGGTPPSFASLLLAWSCLLSRCLPQEVGTQPVLAP